MKPGTHPQVRWGTIALSMLAACAVHAQTPTTLYSFTRASGDGDGPQAAVVMDSAGNLFGTTVAGGTGTACTGGCGTVFELVKNTDGSYTETILYSFTNTSGDGAQPSFGTLAIDSVGNLFGTTTKGGAGSSCSGGCGIAFELVNNSNGTYTENILYTFTGQNGDGATPWGGLILDSAGNLYGTTQAGGNPYYGTVFELVKNANGSYSESILHNFIGTKIDGIGPTSSLLMDSAGNLYGTTTGGASGYGTVFELVKNLDGSYTEKLLYSFLGGSGDGSEPYAGLIMDSAGNLYGTTVAGGSSAHGTVFELVLNPNGTYSETVLHSFTGINGDGSGPYTGSLVLDPSGLLYGTTAGGGAGSSGTIFAVGHLNNNSFESALYSFPSPGSPEAGLLIDSAGNLYGTTLAGGSYQLGSVFRLTPGVRAPTRIQLTSSSNPALAGDSVTFTATVSSTAGIPPGWITFSEGSTILGTVALASGQAQLVIGDVASLGVGTYTITAQYISGAYSFLPGSGAMNQTVNESGVALTTGSNTFAGNQTILGSVTATSFAGDGSALTNVNAASLAGVAAGDYARLDLGNNFSGNQSVNGNVNVKGNATTAGTMTIGGMGTPISEHLSVFVNPPFPALKPLTCSLFSFRLLGAADADSIALGVSNARMVGGGTLFYMAWVNAPNTVAIRACNMDSQTAQSAPGSGPIRVDLWKHQ